MERRLRLRRNEDFNRLYRRGNASYNRHFKLIGRRNGKNRNRYGFSLSKKLGKAHVRNLLKRRLREIVRIHADSFPNGYDFVFVPRNEAVALSYAELESSVLHVLKHWNPEKKNRKRGDGK